MLIWDLLSLQNNNTVVLFRVSALECSSISQTYAGTVLKMQTASVNVKHTDDAYPCELLLPVNYNGEITHISSIHNCNEK